MNPEEMKLCKAKIYQKSCPLPDVEERVREVCGPLLPSVKAGARIALAVGSRGIANIDHIVKTVADCLISVGAKPFIVPAMGSHGGAVAEGQAELLEGYGISERIMGIPVLSSMDVEYLGDADCDAPLPVHMDSHAFGADGVIVVNRVKAHTDFHGVHESGIVKMLVIGLGKHRQAILMHRFGADGLRDLVPVAAKKVLESGKIIGGIGIIEDGFDDTADVVFAYPDEFFEVDAELLARSKTLMAKLPFEHIDALVIDCMGKNISGTGMDPNVIGRMRIMGQLDDFPVCRTIAVLDLTDVSHGNATGVGLADIVTQKLSDKIDWKVTYENIVTSGFLQRGFLPVVAGDSLAVVGMALSAGNYTDESIRFARIRDTLHLDEAYLSKALMDELKACGKGEQLSEFKPLSFFGGELEGF